MTKSLASKLWRKLALTLRNRDLPFNRVRRRTEMKRTSAQILMAIATFLTVTGLYAQNGQKPAYLNPDLPASHRAEDLVRRMTVEEKVTQLVNQSRAIPRLNVPEYNWWSEASHGIATRGASEESDQGRRSTRHGCNGHKHWQA